jgi:hypothetical protein
MSFIATSTHSVLPSGNATSRHDAKRLLVLEEGCPLFVPGQNLNWVTAYCSQIDVKKTGVTIAVMYAGATLKVLQNMEHHVRDNLGVHFGKIVILGSYHPAAQEYHEESISLSATNRNTLYLLSHEFVDGMLHDSRFPQLENDDCLRTARQEALCVIFGINAPNYDTLRAHYKLSCGTTLFTSRQSPRPSVHTKAELQEVWRETERIIGPMPAHDPQASAIDPKEQHDLTCEFWAR